MLRNSMRIGFGTDIHRLVEGRKLILAGVNVPAPFGELAHSDGDVVYHALMDAILGALALGDIGKLFPDNDNQYKDIDSSATTPSFTGRNAIMPSGVLPSICFASRPRATIRRLSLSMAATEGARRTIFFPFM